MPEPLKPFPAEIIETADELIAKCRAAHITLTTAESCTGGMIAGCLTEVPGASAVFDRGLVTYSNAAKTALLGVSETMLKEYGAVSAPVARAMADGAASGLGADRAVLAVAVTGVAGPEGGTADKPVGLVYIAAALRQTTGVAEVSHVECRFGDPGRTIIRMNTVGSTFELALKTLAGRRP